MNGNAALEALFPGLKPGQYRIIRTGDPRYNCIAWAVGRSDKWWWPIGAPMTFWPPGILRDTTPSAFIQLFGARGYEPCDNPSFVPEFEKVAIFAVHQEVKHAARQLSSGAWTSKLGALDLIEHELTALEGTHYGEVVQVMRRRRGFVQMLRDRYSLP
jgi:hypothetical protein